MPYKLDPTCDFVSRAEHPTYHIVYLMGLMYQELITGDLKELSDTRAKSFLNFMD